VLAGLALLPRPALGRLQLKGLQLLRRLHGIVPAKGLMPVKRGLPGPLSGWPSLPAGLQGTLPGRVAARSGLGAAAASQGAPSA
jgi:hypothetical protein